MAMDWMAAEGRAHKMMGWPEGDPGGAVVGFDRLGIRCVATSGAAHPGGAAFTADTVVRWASVTKHVFAAFVMQTGVDLDAPLVSFLPQMHPVPGAVTLRQALAMQGGLPDTREALTLMGFGPGDITRANDLLEWSAAIPHLNAAPGTEVAYSNAGYRLVEAALAARGHRFADWVAAQAMRLGLTMRASEYWTDPVEGLVPGHVPVPGGWAEGGQGMHLSAAGSLSGSARDLALWVRDLSASAVFADLAAPVPLADGRATGYGLGLRDTWIGGRRVPGHGGSQAGYKSAFLVDMETGAGVAVVCNRDDAAAGDIAQAVMAALLGDAPAAPFPARDWATPGLYVAETGNLWVEVRATGPLTVRDADEAIFATQTGIVAPAAQARIELRAEGDALVGEVGHVPVRLIPARADPAAGRLDGLWICDGATFAVQGETVIWGRGPTRETSDLTSLGNGRWLFRAMGRRICLRRIAEGEVELSLSRARVIRYRRMSSGSARP
ncbi:serine hydrolase domain-containing protein [Falsirhodobacter halotolerans]|uniref:serine hydrolase domain-containing protein n=1 Tax=Falsirhodobacter halotolerans TaxID=1146892 RepID=UPI001FD2B5F3|nr:serine hydrolase domain-containing protein [Falsirhodobacter halotolerans]MCJ8139996.1 beta-lactamase family protein [Falsirhodobacter halotolerans]